MARSADAAERCVLEGNEDGPYPETTALELRDTTIDEWLQVGVGDALALDEIGRGVESLQGVVPNHELRKRVHWHVQRIRSNEVVNELRVASSGSVAPRRILGALKRDRYLRGVPFSVGEPSLKRGLFVSLFFGEGGVVTTLGRVPDATYRDYLEARLWVAAGVQRVINLVRVARPIAEQADTEVVAAQLLGRSDRQADANLDVAMEFDCLTIQGTVAHQRQSDVIEQEMWAIPAVEGVNNRINWRSSLAERVSAEH